MNDSPLISFSLDAIRQLVKTRDDLLRQYEEANRKVEALSVLVPDHFRERIFGTQNQTHPSSTGLSVQTEAVAKVAAPPPSLADAIVEMLDEGQEVMSQDQIEEAVWNIPDFSDRTRYTVEEIAKELERVARRGRVTKRGMNYCSKQMSVDGRALYGGPTMIEATEKILRKAGEGLEAWEVIDALRKDPDVGERVKQRPNGVYAALSRLTSRRIAYRDVDGSYRIGAK